MKKMKNENNQRHQIIKRNNRRQRQSEESVMKNGSSETYENLANRSSIIWRHGGENGVSAKIIGGVSGMAAAITAKWQAKMKYRQQSGGVAAIMVAHQRRQRHGSGRRRKIIMETEARHGIEA